ncbi:MAG TPA: hypothetical protein VK157_12060 [Phycisphaerales bacterium]|nr:hypothetical protein [Phycisphaerales bacterium]
MRTAGLLALLFAASQAAAQFQTFQGKLDQSGSPANGVFDFRVEHFDTSLGGSPIGLTNVLNAVNVNNGLFNLTYDASNIFNGSPRWVQISVRPTGSADPFTPVIRQRITATPYAIRSLNERWTPITPTQLATDPGISSVFINAPVAPFPDAALTTRGSTDTFSGIYSDVASGTGVSYYGWAVGGLSKLEARYSGISNRFTMGTDTATFLYIESDGRIGIGGVPATTSILQVTGDARVSSNAAAGSFSYTSPQTRSISLPPGAFQGSGSANPSIGTDRVFFAGAAATTGTLVAPINLPEGATVTAVRAHVVDNTAGTISLDLWRNTFTGGTVLMASATSVGAVAGTRAISDTTIASPIIANSTGAYAIWVSCDSWDINNCMLRAVQVEYTVPGPD